MSLLAFLFNQLRHLPKRLKSWFLTDFESLFGFFRSEVNLSSASQFFTSPSHFSSFRQRFVFTNASKCVSSWWVFLKLGKSKGQPHPFPGQIPWNIYHSMCKSSVFLQFLTPIFLVAWLFEHKLFTFIDCHTESKQTKSDLRCFHNQTWIFRWKPEQYYITAPKIRTYEPIQKSGSHHSDRVIGAVWFCRLFCPSIFHPKIYVFSYC